MLPGCEAGFRGDVFKDDGTGLYEAAGGHGTMLAVEHGRMRAAGVDACSRRGLRALGGLWCLLLKRVHRQGTLRAQRPIPERENEC